ncbi:MAG: hypothetical protein HQL23_07410 [Candidatus Omnitrophica bacterium]|nr:hypothetical protein [Candidatus Omnitrophota bacterium]
MIHKIGLLYFTKCLLKAGFFSLLISPANVQTDFSDTDVPGDCFSVGPWDPGNH